MFLLLRNMLPATLLAGCMLGATPVAPSVNPVIVVEINAPGVDADEIERAITIPLERALDGLAGVVAMNSTSTWQSCRIELSYGGRPSNAAVEQVTAIVLAEWLKFDVTTSRPAISVRPGTLR